MRSNLIVKTPDLVIGRYSCFLIVNYGHNHNIDLVSVFTVTLNFLLPKALSSHYFVFPFSYRDIQSNILSR